MENLFEYIKRTASARNYILEYEDKGIFTSFFFEKELTEDIEFCLSVSETIEGNLSAALKMVIYDIEPQEFDSRFYEYKSLLLKELDFFRELDKKTYNIESFLPRFWEYYNSSKKFLFVQKSYIYW